MYTQELVCPNCDEIATVNVITSLQKENPQSGLCRACSKWIDFDVDTEGEIMEIRATDRKVAKPGGYVRGGGGGGGGGNREPRW
jgi:hypothetical protein